MNLNEYLSVRGRKAALSKATGLAPAYIWQIVHGVRPLPIERCVAIETATQGVVSRKDLRPNDWHVIWPELVNKHALSCTPSVQSTSMEPSE